MKANNTPNISDLARWIDIQLSTIIEGVSAGYTLGNYNSVWIDKGATVFNVSLANGETVEIDSDNYNTAEEIANAIIATLNNNTQTTMNANETTSANIEHANRIAGVINGAKCRGAWQNGVKTYALMLLNWYKEEASENPLTLETMLNGAKDWKQYAYGGAGVAQCYNAAIAETLCSPSELKRTKGGAKAPNNNETWCDVEARALFRAWQAIKQAELLPQF